MINDNGCVRRKYRQGTHRLLQKLISLSFIIYHLSFSVACYNRGQQTPDALSLTEAQIDSISFYTTHHYTEGYNFQVHADSLPLIQQLPAEAVIDMPVDTLQIYRRDIVVVADIVTVPADSIDSVWVKVARDEFTLGWIHESELLTGVSPDDPISAFIDFFSNAHLLIFLALVALTGAIYVLRHLMQRNAKIVHLNDIPSFYPTLLCLLLAFSATLYSSIQLFDPEKWRHFYYHPTLNPYAVPFWLGLFLCTVWAIVLVGVATLDDVRRRLPFGEALLYLLGLGAVCAVVYVVFSVFTLYYIGYPLLIVYVVWALRRYKKQPRSRYLCGNCGAELKRKGRCPYCGAYNE